jgi:hypothetical protein
MVLFRVEAYTTASSADSTRIYQDGGNSPTTRGHHKSLFNPTLSLLSSSAPLFSARTSVKSSKAKDTTALSTLPPAYIIERISNLPTNDKLFERISNMCIDVFFKELLLESPKPPINGTSNPMKGKL